MCKFWIYDFGDFGFWIWGILDFGFQNLGMLDFEVWGMEKFGCNITTKFWMLHKKRRLGTPTRVGGLMLS